MAGVVPRDATEAQLNKLLQVVKDGNRPTVEEMVRNALNSAGGSRSWDKHADRVFDELIELATSAHEAPAPDTVAGLAIDALHVFLTGLWQLSNGAGRDVFVGIQDRLVHKMFKKIQEDKPALLLRFFAPTGGKGLPLARLLAADYSLIQNPQTRLRVIDVLKKLSYADPFLKDLLVICDRVDLRALEDKNPHRMN